jgi:energy-coupling factor transporter ATP-binding protein EcfA2
MIRFDRVTYTYGDDGSGPALDNFSISIEEGEELAVIGGNGSGKTTFGLLLCGILKPQSGSIEIDGKPPSGGEATPAVGFLFQDPDNGLVATTVEREVAFSLENRNAPPEEIRRVVEDTLNLFNLGGYRRRLVWQLSGGEKQRLSLAGLFAAGSKILFLDEPASYLDYAGAKQLEETLAQVKRADPSMAIIRVTQYPTIAERYLRVVVLDKGKIVNDNAPEEVFSDSATLSGAGLRPPLRYLIPKSNKPPIIPQPSREISGDIILKIKNLTFNYNINNAPYLIDNMSLDITHKEVLGLVGPSGCGKSTLAQLVCGIYTPLGGTISFPAPDSRAVMSFQQSERQFFLDTVFDEISYGIREKHNTNEELTEAVRQSMEMAGLGFSGFKDRDPHNLSGGEARRLAFAVIVALDADLVIFDEPTCGLDEVGIGFFRKLVTNLKKDGKTVIIISHDSNILGDLADRIALLAEGKIKCLLDPIDFFGCDEYKGILSIPEVINYQTERFGKAYTSRTDRIFDT